MRMYELTAALVRRGYTDEHIRLVLGGNWAPRPHRSLARLTRLSQRQRARQA